MKKLNISIAIFLCKVGKFLVLMRRAFLQGIYDYWPGCYFAPPDYQSILYEKHKCPKCGNEF